MRLRNSSKSQTTGVRRWYFRREMVEKWGEEITAAMIEDKLSDEERRRTEIRTHPDMKAREDRLHVTYDHVCITPCSIPMVYP